MPADPKEIVIVVREIRDALAHSKAPAIPEEQRSQEMAAAVSRACTALRDLVDDEEYWRVLEQEGPYKAAMLVGFATLSGEFDRATMAKLGEFLVAVGFRPPDEARGFVENAISAVLRGTAYTILTETDRASATRAHTSARNLRDEVCRLSVSYQDGILAKRSRWQALRIGSSLGQAAGRVLSGGLLGFASSPALGALLPSSARAIAADLTAPERTLAAAAAIRVIATEDGSFQSGDE